MYFLWINENNTKWEKVLESEDKDVLSAKKVEMQRETGASRSIGRTAKTRMFKITEYEIDSNGNRVL
jgi:hypothetical protein